MLNLKRYLLTLCCTLTLAASHSPARAQSAPLPSGADLLAQSAKAYDALTSYSCHTAVTASGIGSQTYQCSADIQFLRPGQLIASGTSMFNTQFLLVTNGAATAVTMNGSTTPCKTAELGVASVTGVAQGAATTIPALLLHTTWGYPFGPGQSVDNNIVIQNVNGQPCYEVLVLAPIKRAYWIDTKTFLIDQVAARITVPGIGTLHQLQTITNSVVDPIIPAGVFTGAGTP